MLTAFLTLSESLYKKRMYRNNVSSNIVIFIFIFCIAFFCPSPSTARGITGIQTAAYRFSPPAPVHPYKNSGYEISESADGIVRIKVDANPLKNNSPYPIQIRNKTAREILHSNQIRPIPPSLSKITREIVQPCRGYFQAVTSILDWVTRHFHYGLNKQSPLAGNCTAAAVLTVQLLSLAGIPARKITGVVVTGKERVLSGNALHSFVEIYYPGTGWLFSDPLASYHFVPANYVVLRSPASDYFGLRLKCVKTPGHLCTVITNDESKIPGRINLFRFN